jgi:hypothetical protein
LNIKSGRKNPQFLQLVKNEGPPKEFFGAGPKESQLKVSQDGEGDNKHTGELRGISTANFIPGNGKISVNN